MEQPLYLNTGEMIDFACKMPGVVNSFCKYSLLYSCSIHTVVCMWLFMYSFRHIDMCGEGLPSLNKL